MKSQIANSLNENDNSATDFIFFSSDQYNDSVKIPNVYKNIQITIFSLIS